MVGNRHFLVVLSDRTEGNERELEHGKIPTNMQKNFVAVRVTEHWNSLPSEVMESPSLEILTTHLKTFLCNLLWGIFFSGGEGEGKIQRFFQPLWFYEICVWLEVLMACIRMIPGRIPVSVAKCSKHAPASIYSITLIVILFLSSSHGEFCPSCAWPLGSHPCSLGIRGWMLSGQMEWWEAVSLPKQELVVQEVCFVMPFKNICSIVFPNRL